MSRVYFVCALAFILMAGSAQAVTMFYDDFSSGTLDQWNVILPSVSVVGTVPDTCAFFDARPTGYGAELGNDTAFALDPGSYQVDFFFLADAPADSTFEFLLWKDLGGGAWLGQGIVVDVNTLDGSITSPWVSSVEVTPYPPESAWTHVTGTFTTTQDSTDFALFFWSDGGVLLMDNFSIAPACVPEPTSLVLMGCGLAGLAARTLRRKKA